MSFQIISGIADRQDIVVHVVLIKEDNPICIQIIRVPMLALELQQYN